MNPAVNLTDEQQAVVDHNFGAAVVHAVAGAGKTTAMVARIARLVRERVFAAEKILATSFSRDTVQNLKTALESQRGCHDVQTKTLHSVGMQIIRQAEISGFLPSNQNAKAELEDIPKALTRRALKMAREQKLEFVPELEVFDEEEFLGFVSACKGNLEYADLNSAPIPKSAKALATQTTSPVGLPWYLDLFVLFEKARLEQGLLTFDDMLLGAWEALVSFPELLFDVQNLYVCVLVDEFQDVNLVQSELLDMLTQKHRNYMVIGDDDQTIYQWRGASPRYILEFAKKYQAKKYIISDNFRCMASQIALANSVIVHNKAREHKYLSLTKGFSGSTVWHLADDALAQTKTLVNELLSISIKCNRL